MKIPYFQQQVSDRATRELSEWLGVPVHIDNVYISWLNRVVLDGVYLEDESGGVLFEANHIAAGFNLFPLLQGRLVFTTARVFGFTMHLRKDSLHDPLNLQFVIDAFTKKDSLKKETNIDLRFNSILVRRGDFTYHVMSEGRSPGKFNPHHIDIRNLSANISLKALNNDSLNATIKRLSFYETSGLTMNKLALHVVGNRDSAFIEDFEIKLPETDFRIARTHINFTEVDSVSQLVNTAPVSLTIAPSTICPKDLAAFVPALVNFTDIVDLSAEASGYINDIDLKRLTLSYSNKMLFNGKMNLRGINHPEEAYIFGEISRMYITNEGISSLVNNFYENPLDLPPEIRNLGNIGFTGEISGFFDNLVAYGRLQSDIGTIQTDILFGNNKEKNIAAFVSGHIRTSDLDIDRLMGGDTSFGIGKFDIHINASRPADSSFSGTINARVADFDFNEYRYSNILLSGRFSQNSFNGTVHLDDPNGYLFAEGIFRNQGSRSVFNFTADLRHFRPAELNLTSQYESPEVGFKLAADFTGNTIDNVEGKLSVDSLLFTTAPSSFFLENLDIEASGDASDRKLTVRSDIINGEVNGAYSFRTFIPSILNTLEGYLPALITTKTKPGATEENNFTLLLTVENTEALSQTLKLPVAIDKPARITGQYNNQYNRLRVEAWLPAFRINKSMFENGYITSSNSTETVELEVRATQYNAKGLRNYLELKADAGDNTLNTLVSWANNKERLFKADISSTTRFTAVTDDRGKKELFTEIDIRSSPFTINDSTWMVEQASIAILNNVVDIDNFFVSRDKQYLRMDGKISPDPADTLLLDLNGIELKYIFDVLNIPALQFAGQATGLFHISDLYNSRMLNTDLEVKNFSFNQTDLGQLNLFSEWDDLQQGILMLGSIYKNDSTWTDVNGYIFPVGENAGLSLYFDANEIDISFLQPFMEKVASNVQGRGSGNVHLYGPFHELDIEGDAFVEDGGLGIDFLNTYYTFSDSIHLRPGGIQANRFVVYDRDGNSGVVNLEVRFNHFKDIEYDVTIAASNMLVYNAQERHNPLIYGTVYGSGTARIHGNEKIVNVDANLETKDKTVVSLNFMGSSTASEYDFITFIDRDHLAGADTLAVDSVYRPSFWTNETADINLDFQLRVNSEANIEIIMDPSAGDKIKGFGSGDMHVEWSNRSDLRMYGDFYITQGSYNFSLQQLIHKDFKIREGSKITFQGDPFYALLDIDGVYSLTANIGDLDQSFAMESPRSSIPVNAVMHIDGQLRNFIITFDIELPGSSDDLVHKVKSYVNTEDMMTRQVLYLLVLNKFYTVDPAVKSNDFGALASSALSYQLSSILNSITDKVQIGTNIRTAQEGLTENTEVEMLLSSQLLNNRLIFNGNFGYRNNYALDANIFVGEFDIEYMLTRSGEIRLKAYNHANDLYQYTQSLTTQGIGIMYRKDFTHISEIFRRRKRITLPPAGTHFVLPEEEPVETLEQ